MVNEVSFEWSHRTISSTDSKIRTTLHVSIIDFGSKRKFLERISIKSQIKLVTFLAGSEV